MNAATAAVLGIFIALTIICVVALCILGSCYSRACRRNRRDLEVQARNEADLRQKYEVRLEDMQRMLNQAHQDALELREKLGQSAVIVQGELHTADITGEIEKLKQERQDLQDKLTADSTKLAGLALTMSNFFEDLARSKEAQLTVENKTFELKQHNQELADEQQKLNGQVNDLNRELQKLLAIQKVVNDNEDHVVWDPILNEKQAKLVSILHDLILMYPDLSLDFASIEWKKIWMPQLQGLGSLIDGKSGVYRLILKDNKMPPLTVERDGLQFELPVCYVGQAVNIKDRWYQHVKKMIGVMAKGNEKLYDWRPEDFKWCLVEVGRDVDLDKSEKYWIGYYAAKEGLKKKVGNS